MASSYQFGVHGVLADLEFGRKKETAFAHHVPGFAALPWCEHLGAGLQ